MSCSNPKKAFQIGITESGKKKMKICSYNTVYVIDDKGDKVYDSVLIPCGKCLSCRLSYAKQWSIRCMLESSFYDENYFITLTYNDDNIKDPSLDKDDLRRFINSLRKALSRKGLPEIRFFACGEYGSRNFRKHFHLIIFNLHLDDLKFLKLSKSKEKLYTSEFLSSLWNKGFVQVGSCTTKSCGYVARYCLKGISHSDLESLGLSKEFILMSRRPGIGFGYFDINKESIYNTDKIYFNFGDFSTSSVPSYFDYLMNKLDPSILSLIKDKRRLKAEWNSFFEFMNSSLTSDLDYLKLKEDVLVYRTRILKERTCE